MFGTGSPPPRSAALAVPAAPSRAPAAPQHDDAAATPASVASPLDHAPHVTALNQVAQRLNAGPGVSAQRKTAHLLGASPRNAVVQRTIVGLDGENLWASDIARQLRDEHDPRVIEGAHRLHSMDGEVRVQDYVDLRRRILENPRFGQIIAASRSESAAPKYQPPAIGPAASAMRAGTATYHQDRLAALGTPSGGVMEYLSSLFSSAPAAPQVALNHIETGAVNNWVSGNWGQMQNYARAIGDPVATAAAVGGSALMGRDVAGEVGALDSVLGKLAPRAGTSYRRSDYAVLDVYSRLIGPGSYVGSPAFFATSTKKGAGGAGGGAEQWGKESKAYFEITGNQGRDLGPYQNALQSEAEILYPRGSVFLVTAVQVEGEAVKVLLRNVTEVPQGTRILDPFSAVDVTAQIQQARVPPAAPNLAPPAKPASPVMER
jgi:hypothetical protein